MTAWFYGPFARSFVISDVLHRKLQGSHGFGVGSNGDVRTSYGPPDPPLPLFFYPEKSPSIIFPHLRTSFRLLVVREHVFILAQAVSAAGVEHEWEL